MENVELKSGVIERLMGFDLCSTQQPIEKPRVLSEGYVRNNCLVDRRRKQRCNENRLSWMETDEPVLDGFDVSTCSSVEQSFSISHPRHMDFNESSNSFDSEVNGKRCTRECELSCIPYFSESYGYSSSTSRGKICLSPTKNDTVNRNVVKGQHDSCRLVQSLQDYLSMKPRTGDEERKLLNMNSQQSSKFRRIIYMDTVKQEAAYTRLVKQKMNLSKSELKDCIATSLLFQSHFDHQRMRYNTPSSNFNDPCLRAMLALKYSMGASKVSNCCRISSIKSKASMNRSRESKHIPCPGSKLARKYSTILESLKDNSQDLVLHRSFSTKMIRQKKLSDITLSVSTSVRPNRLSDYNQISSDVNDGSKHQQDTMQALPGKVFDMLLSPEPLSPRNLEEAFQHSPVSVLKSSADIGEVSESESDHFNHVSLELQELRMQLRLLETEFPERFYDNSVTDFSNNEDKQEELLSPGLLCNVKLDASEFYDLLKKELVMDSRWFDLGEEINAIGTELECLLMDELIEDFIYS